MNKLPKILPCPICGRVPLIAFWAVDKPLYSAECHSSTDILYHTVSAHGQSKLITIKRWNKLVRPLTVQAG